MPAMAPRPREVNRAGYKAYSLLPSWVLTQGLCNG